MPCHNKHMNWAGTGSASILTYSTIDDSDRHNGRDSIPVSAISTLYVLVGYPVLLAFLAKHFSKPVRKQDHQERVSVIIPVRNGEQWLARKIESVLAQDYPAELREIVIVSDGSTDSSESIAMSYADRGIRLIRVPQGGKPAALNAAVPHGDGRSAFPDRCPAGARAGLFATVGRLYGRSGSGRGQR